MILIYLYQSSCHYEGSIHTLWVRWARICAFVSACICLCVHLSVHLCACICVGALVRLSVSKCLLFLSNLNLYIFWSNEILLFTCLSILLFSPALFKQKQKHNFTTPNSFIEKQGQENKMRRWQKATNDDVVFTQKGVATTDRQQKFKSAG